MSDATGDHLKKALEKVAQDASIAGKIAADASAALHLSVSAYESTRKCY